MNTLRSFGALACAVALSFSPVKADPPGGTAGWTLSFEDNFNGTALDTTKWTAPTRQDGAPWNYQTPNNAVVANGILTQRVTQRDSTPTFHISEIETINKFEPVYGYIEARTKTSWSPSSWPSFWMISRYGWPPELDIYENWGGTNAAMSAQNWHYRNSSGAEEGDAKGVWLPTSHPDYWGAGYGGDYYVYGAHWQEGRIDFYINGVLTHTSTKEVTSLPMYIVLSNGLGGAQRGNPDFTGGPADKFNQKVDYVKVWTRPLGTELSRSGWVASASSSGPWNPPSNAIDASAQTKWGSGGSQFNGQWFQVDLGSAKTFDTVVVKSYENIGDAPAGVQLFVSDTPGSWGSAVATKVDNANIQELNTVILKFPSTTKRYLRLVQTGTKSNWWGIDDLRVYSNVGTTPPPAAPIPDGTYKIINRKSGKALDLPGSVTTDGIQFQQYTYGGGNNQRFSLTVQSNGNYKITAVHSGDSLAVANGSTADGAAVIQWPFSGGTDQRWKLQATTGSYFKIVNEKSNKVLGVSGGSTSNGAKTIIWPSNTSTDQEWTLTAP